MLRARAERQLDSFSTDSISSVTSINEGINACALSRKSFHKVLMSLQRGKHFLSGHVVEERALPHRADRDCSTKLAIARLEYCNSSFLEQSPIELLMVHRKTSA